MIDDFEKFLEWRYGVKVVNGSYTLDDGYIMALALTDAQWKRVLSQKDMIQTYVFRAKSSIAFNMNVPFSLQREGKITSRGNLLILSGSDVFIDIMLFQFFGYKNQKAEEIFCIPLQNRINGSGDKPAINFLNSLNLQEETMANLKIPADLLDVMKKQLSQSDYKKRLLVSLGLAFYALKGWCNGFDKARITGKVLEYDIDTEDIDEYDMSESNKMKIQYKTYMETCQKLVADANIYMDELGWRQNDDLI